MSELEDRINSVLNDPGQLEQISALAQSLMGGAAAPPEEDKAVFGKLSSLMGGEEGRSQALLRAMQPYLSEKRRQKMSRALQFARLAGLARLAMRETEGKDESL